MDGSTVDGLVKINHACADCIPGGPLVIPGFRCEPHAVGMESFDELWDRTAKLAKRAGLSLEEVTVGWRGVGYLAATLDRSNDVRALDAAGNTPTAALRNLAAILERQES